METKHILIKPAVNGEWIMQHSDNKNVRKRKMFENFIVYLDNENIEYCIVGKINLIEPWNTSHDIDIIIEKKIPSKFPEKVLEFCEVNNIQLVQVFQHENTAWYFVLMGYDKNGKPFYLLPDISVDFIRNGRVLLYSKDILRDKQKEKVKGSDLCFNRLSAKNEFIYYLLKKIGKQNINKEHEAYLDSQWRHDPAGATDQINHFWTDEYSMLLIQAAKKNEWQTISRRLPELQKVLEGGIKQSIHCKISEFLRKIKRFLSPTGLVVAFLGPDGSGKSGVAEQISIDLAPAFRQVNYIHLRPRLGLSKKSKYEPVTRPHLLPVRGWFSSIIKLIYFLFDYTVGYALIVRSKKVRSTLVVFDRYYHDLLVDVKRYRYGGPMWIAWLIGKLIPKPDLWILLDAPAEVIQIRKQEVHFNESERQRQDYIKLVSDFPNSVIVDASKPLNNVVNDVNRAILNFMATRINNRLKR